MSPHPILEPSQTDEANSNLEKIQGVGSDTWMGANVYEPDDRLYTESMNFFHAVKWYVLAAIASKHRKGIGCRFSDKFSLGHFNMVRRLTFDDGVSWVARVRLPRKEAGAEIGVYDSQRAFETESAALLYFK